MPLDALVNPRSVAIVGATDRPGPGRQVIESLGAIGFTGAIYPVNPKYPTVLNHVCYPSLAELPEAPDIVVLSVRNALVPEQMKLAVKRGARAAVIYDNGFAELGADGARLQEEIAGLCREAGMAVCGPNCMGIINPIGRVTTYKQTVMKTEGLAGNVGLISQSGSVCIAMLSDLRRYGFSLAVSAGNEAVTRTVDYLDYLIDDPATKVIATFTETVREPERYVAALDRAAAAGKPVVVLKVGRTERTQRAITSHTGGLAGESRVFSELLRAHRAIEVNDLDEMTEVLAVCQGKRWPRGRGISVITGSGGLAEMILDNATAGRHSPSAAHRRGAQRRRERDRPHHRRRQSVRRLGQRQLRRQPAARHVGGRQEPADQRDRLLRRHQRTGPPGRPVARAGQRRDAGEGVPRFRQALLPDEFTARTDEHPAGQRAARARHGADRRHPPGTRRDRADRPLHDAAAAAATVCAQADRHARGSARRPPRPAHHQRIRRQAVARRLWRSGDARAARRHAGGGAGSSARAWLSGGAEGRVGRHSAQDRAWPGRHRAQDRRRACRRLRTIDRAARPRRSASAGLRVPGTGVRARRCRGLRRHIARSGFRPDALRSGSAAPPSR